MAPSLARSMAFQIAALSAGVAANSAASVTDLWGENTMSKPLSLRFCTDHASPVSARRASNSRVRSASRGMWWVSIPAARAKMAGISGRQAARLSRPV